MYVSWSEYKPNGMSDETIDKLLRLANIQLKLFMDISDDSQFKRIINVMQNENGEQAWKKLFSLADFQGCTMVIDAFPHLIESELINHSVKLIVDKGIENIHEYLNKCTFPQDLNMMTKITQRMCLDPNLVDEVPPILRSWFSDKQTLTILYMQHGFINEAFEEAKVTKNQSHLILICRFALEKCDYDIATKCQRLIRQF